MTLATDALSKEVFKKKYKKKIQFFTNGLLANGLKGIGRERNPLLLALAGDLMNYRGNRSGLLPVKKEIPDSKLENDIEGERVIVTIPL